MFFYDHPLISYIICIAAIFIIPLTVAANIRNNNPYAVVDVNDDFWSSSDINIKLYNREIDDSHPYDIEGNDVIIHFVEKY